MGGIADFGFVIAEWKKMKNCGLRKVDCGLEEREEFRIAEWKKMKDCRFGGGYEVF